MSEMSQSRYRLFRRGKVFYKENVQTRKQTSLKTCNRSHAEKIIQALNESIADASLKLEMGERDMRHADPRLTGRPGKM